MTIWEEYTLSSYEELVSLGEHDNVKLVKNKVTDKICVKKTLTNYSKDVYSALKENHIEGIPHIYEIIEDEDRLIIIEEHIDGQTLDKEYPGKNDIKTVISVVKKLCGILKQIHGLNPPIIHRDIKPENIMADGEGNIYLTDFNISREYTEKQSRDTVIMGTNGYASPEQYGFAQTDARSDIYSLGILMKNMLKIEQPENEEEEKVIKVIEKCTAIDPDRRYDSIDEMEWDLGSGNPKVVSYLPPGFRSGKISHMLTALFGYMFIIWMSISMITDNDPQYETKEKIAMGVSTFIWGLVMVGIIFDYRGIRKKIPMVNSRKKATRIRGYLIWSTAILAGIFSVAIMLTSF